jgi:hypothetical protein
MNETQMAAGGGAGVFLVQLVIVLAIWAFMFWKVFTKAGQPGWASLIPIYNGVVLLQIAGKPVWWIILFLIPIVGLIMALLVCLGVAENFGKGAGFGIGLWLLSIIFFPILGFGSAEYQGGGGALADPAPAPVPPPPAE